MEGGNVTKWNGLDSGHETGVGMVGSRVCMVPCMWVGNGQWEKMGMIMWGVMGVKKLTACLTI